MKLTATDISGVFLIELEPVTDQRGSFTRTWCKDRFRAFGLDAEFVQCGQSYNQSRGTLRRLHYQAEPYGQTRLIQVLRGRIYDVVVDIRPQSPDYLRWQAFELAADDPRMLYICQGCAHGFQTLEDKTEVAYQFSTHYREDASQGIRWDDPALGIFWPDASRRILSQRDRSWPLVEYSPSPNS